MREVSSIGIEAKRGHTKRRASKQIRQKFAEEIRRADKEPPEASFDNIEDMLAYLNSEA